MTNLEKKFAELKSANRKGIIIYITAGAPDVETSIRAVLEAEKNGADVIEIGIPFSDPMADGPVILKSSTAAIRNGMTVAGVLEVVKKIREKSQIPIVAMGYINNLLSYGFEKFVEDAKSVGMDGLILPDVPHEESEVMRKICAEKNFHLMEFLTPLTTPERMKETCSSANGFIYGVSNTGVTGVKKIDFSKINSVIEKAREFTKTPMAVGFGIGGAESAIDAAEVADAIIIGSAVVSRLMDGKFDDAMKFVADIRQALDKKYS